MIELNNSDELEKITKNNLLVLADFWATWCGPCRMLMPILEQVEPIIKNLLIVKINVDNFKELAAEYEVISIPTLVLFKNGVEIDSHSGFISQNNLINWINDN